MKIGSTNIINAKIGSTNIQKVFSGLNLVWSAVDPDAQAFITAAAITDPTQQSAINQLVVDLKGYGVWTKMKALYPFVGGTASQHKFNLKDPRDLDAAFRMVFNGGWTHSANGALPNGVNGYADTKLNAFTLPLNQNSTSFSAYSRTQTAPSNQMIIGTVFGGFTGMSFIQCNVTGGAGATGIGVYSTSTGVVNNNTTGLFVASRNASNNFIAQIRGNQTTLNFSSAQPYNQSFYIGGSTFNSVYDNKQVAFAHIGDGLNSTELTNLNTAVQTFQTTLGRSIGTQTVSDADAQAFVTNAGIVDQVEANAINNLVIGMKADGVWSKMKAIYPFVGGTASTHKFNLKNPLDTDAAFRLVFNGGWTHSSTGATPNGTNAFANSFLTPSSSLTFNNASFSIYSRTNPTITASQAWGCADSTGYMPLLGGAVSASKSINSYFYNFTAPDVMTSATGQSSSGLILSTRTSSTSAKLFKNSTIIATTSSNGQIKQPNQSFTFGGLRSPSTGIQDYNVLQHSFASIGDGLNDTEATNLNTRVTTFQTALNRNV